MRIKGYFFILLILLSGLCGLLLYLAGKLSPVFLYVGEGILLIILFYLIFFYRKIVKPLDIIGNGMELLREQDFSSRLSLVGQYEADRVVNVFNRMMEQLKNERLRLREQNHLLDLLINASPMGVIIMSLDEDISDLNPMALKMLGVRSEEVLHRKLTELRSPLAEELATIRQGTTITIRLNDSNIYKCIHSSFVDRGFPHSFFLVERLTEEVMKAEKKAYEKVIRMIAHEVNNTTAGIISTLDTVGQVLSSEEDKEDICEVMRICMERCFSMSRFIIRFADVVKIPDPHLLPVNLNELVTACTRFMEGMCIDRDISLRLELSNKPVNVKLDALLFEQVLVNIVKNAVESIETNGEIIVRTFPDTLEIVDNGKGIDKETETKLFTPFFSTKAHGQGLGLIFIREILMRHGCTFSLRTSADRLTRFRILFN